MTWEVAFRLVCGEIGFAPSEFYRLQYSELKLIVEGYGRRRRSDARERMEQAARMTAWQLMPYKKEGKDAGDFLHETYLSILGRKDRSEPAQKFASPEAAASAFFAAREAKLKHKKGA